MPGEEGGVLHPGRRAMPFGLKLRRTRRYNVLSKNCFVTRIRLLDSNVIECTLSVESTGQECLEAVAQRLELREVSWARVPVWGQEAGVLKRASYLLTCQHLPCLEEPAVLSGRDLTELPWLRRPVLTSEGRAHSWYGEVGFLLFPS